MGTLRSALRFVGTTFADSEMVYSFLMSLGWFFLLGWAISLIVACISVFRHENPGTPQLHAKMHSGKVSLGR